MWGLGLSIVSVIHGKEPLHTCSTRSQVEIEVGEAWKDGECRARGERVFRRGSFLLFFSPIFRSNLPSQLPLPPSFPPSLP